MLVKNKKEERYKSHNISHCEVLQEWREVFAALVCVGKEDQGDGGCSSEEHELRSFDFTHSNCHDIGPCHHFLSMKKRRDDEA